MTTADYIIALVQLFVLGFQAWLLRGSLEATKASAEATRLAANAAQKSAEVAEKSVDRLERPYVLVENVEPKIKEYMGGPPAYPEPPQLTLSLKNYGRSPALVLEVRGQLQMIAPGADPFLISGIPLGNVVVIGPHDRWQETFRYSNLVEDGVRSQIESQVFHFWFFVSVRYEDMLGKEHQTQMRFRYAVRENRFSMVQGDDYTIRT